MDESEKLKENRIGAVIFYLVIVLIVVLAFKYYQKVLSGEVDHSGESVKSSMERCLRLHANGGDYWNVCKREADEGNIEAYRLLIKQTEKDLTDVEHRYEKADSNDELLRSVLRSTAVDYHNKLTNLYKECAYINDLKCVKQLAIRLHFQGKDVFQLFMKCAEANDAECMLAVGEQMYEDDENPIRRNEGFHWMLKAAETGNPYACNRVGNIYLSYHEDKKAFEFFKKGVEMTGDPYAKVNLLECYENGLGTERNPEKVFEISKDLAVDFDTYYLGHCYEMGIGVGRDYLMAAKMYSRTSHVLALEHLARFYETGRAVEKDLFKAFDLYTKSDTPYSHYRLGKMYERGQGCSKDSYKAIAHYQRACERGSQKGCEAYSHSKKKGIYSNSIDFHGLFEVP